MTFSDALVVRRLAPNSRKLQFGKLRRKLGERLLAAMGADVAAVHLATPGAGPAIRADLKSRESAWLADAARRVAVWTEDEFSQLPPRLKASPRTGDQVSEWLPGQDSNLRHQH